MDKAITKVFMFALIMVFASAVFCQEQEDNNPTRDVNLVTIVGKITQINVNANPPYIIVGNNKITTTRDLLEEADFVVGENVQIIAKKEGNLLRIVNYDYLSDDDDL